MSARPEQRMNSYASVDTSTANATSDGMFGVLLLAVAALVFWYLELPPIYDLTSADFNPFIVLAIILAAIGIVFLTRAARATIRERKFGWSTLAPPTARVGGLYRGTLCTSRDLEPTGDYQFTIECIRRRVPTSDSAGKSGSSNRVVHKDQRKIAFGGKSSLGLPVEFMIPAGSPRSGSTRKDPDGRVRWVVTVTAPMRGVNYYATFAIQVS